MCNFRLTLSLICFFFRKMRHKYVRYDFFLFPVCVRIVVLFAVVVEIVTQGVCLCVTIPRSATSKTAPFYFMRIKHSQFFLSIYFLKITYLWRTLRRHARCFLKISLILPQSLTKSLSETELSSLLI